MSDTAEALVEQMVAAGEWPEPSVFEAIVAQGEQAVPPLVEIIRRDAHGWPDEAPLDHALGLLSMLPAREAVSAVLDLFNRYDNEVLESIPYVLRPFGAEVVEPLLPVLQNLSIDWYARAVANQIALEASRSHPDLRARVTGLMRHMLADLVSRASTVTSRERTVGSSLVVDMAQLADPQDRELIQAALDAGMSEMIGENDVEYYYKHGEPEPNVDVEDWLTDYRRRYQEHLEAERLETEPEPLPKPLTQVKAQSLRQAPYQRPEPVRVERRIGRNDPCWCGSGKKYKNCHLREETR
jgi:hypothetical protein